MQLLVALLLLCHSVSIFLSKIENVQLIHLPPARQVLQFFFVRVSVFLSNFVFLFRLLFQRSFFAGQLDTHTCMNSRWMLLIGWLGLDVFRSVLFLFFVYTLNYHRFYTSTQKHIYTEVANLWDYKNMVPISKGFVVYSFQNKLLIVRVQQCSKLERQTAFFFTQMFVCLSANVFEYFYIFFRLKYLT